MNPEHPPLIKKIAASSLLRLEVWPPRGDLTDADAPGAVPASLLRMKRW